MADNGTTAQPIPFNLPEWMAISAFTALAWYNVLQLNISIFLTFKRRRGLYFWSLLVSGYGVMFHSVGFLVKLFELTDYVYLPICLITIGWWLMVTGQSLVLYSRLHLLVKDQRILRAVLFMIIWNAITLHIPTTILTFGSNSPDWQQFVPVFNVYERIQMTIFSLQELIISAIYLWAAFRLLKPIYRQRIRSVMMQLLWVNFTMVALDISILVMEYSNYYAIEATLKSMVYAIKLILEFAVLNQLMKLANSSRTNQELGRTDGHDNRNSSWDGHPPAQRKNRLASFFRPSRVAGSELASIATDKDGGAARIGSLARRNESIAESGHDFSALIAPKDGNPLDVPSLIIDPEKKQWPSDNSPTTIVTNPAAFSPRHRRPTDPFSLDGLTPSCSDSDLTAPSKTLTRRTSDDLVDPLDTSGMRTMAHQNLSRVKDVPEPDDQDEERQVESKTPAQPSLLQTRRASVSEFGDDEEDIVDDCESDSVAPPPETEATLQRLSAALSAHEDNITPSWLVAEETAASDQPPISDSSIQNAAQHRRSSYERSEQHQTTQNDSIDTKFGYTGVRHSVTD